MHEKRLADLDLRTLTNRRFFPSPAAWEDQVLYFLLVDRFSDGGETGHVDVAGNTVTTPGTPPFGPPDAGNAIQTEQDARRWRDAGGGFVGGTLRGLHGKLGYLRRLGVTAIWISPVLKQVAFREPYHGYGIQDFLGVDPQFLRPVSGNGRDFGIPESVGGRLRSIVPWSRIFDDREVLLAINTDPREARTAWVTVDDAGHRAGDRLRCLYSTDAAQLGKDVAVEPRNGKAVRLEVEPGGFVAYGR